MPRYTSKTGPCRFQGPPGMQTVLLSRPDCYDPPYRTGGCSSDLSCGYPQDGSLNCYENFATRGSCSFDAECNSALSDGICQAGSCGPFVSANPQVIGMMPPNYRGDQTLRCKSQPLRVRQGDEEFTVCPIYDTERLQPQTNTALRQVWQCDRFKDNDWYQYTQCKMYADAMVYNIWDSNRRIWLGVRMDGGAPSDALEAANLALTKICDIAGNCNPTTCTNGKCGY